MELEGFRALQSFAHARMAHSTSFMARSCFLAGLFKGKPRKSLSWGLPYFDAFSNGLIPKAHQDSGLVVLGKPATRQPGGLAGR